MQSKLLGKIFVFEVCKDFFFFLDRKQLKCQSEYKYHEIC